MNLNFIKTKIDTCKNHRCIRGECITSETGIASCICPLDFTGRFCEVSLNYCNNNPCQNGGICKYPFSYNLTCKPGLTGNHCDIVMDMCSSAPCRSRNATCVSGINSFKYFEIIEINFDQK